MHEAEIAAEDIAGKVKVSRRTIFRDLRLLAHAGITFRYNHDERNYRADKLALLPPVAISHAEAMALLLALQHATRPDQAEVLGPPEWRGLLLRHARRMVDIYAS